MDSFTSNNKKRKLKHYENSTNKKQVKFSNQVEVKTITPLKPKKKQKQKKQLSGAAKRKRSRENKQKEMMQAEEDDDAIIAEMEKKLNVKKGKKLQSLANDGLDYILDVIDGAVMDQGSDDDELLPTVTGTDEEDTDISDLEEEKNEDEEEEEETEEVDESPVEEESSAEESEEKADIKQSKPQVVEKTKKPDIYGRDSKVKYIPPAKRLEMMGECRQDAVTRQHLKGQINRLSMDNMAPIVQIIRDMSTRNRGLIRDEMIRLMMSQFDVYDPIPERIISENMMLVVIVTSHSGVGLLATLVERFCVRFVELHKDIKKQGDAKNMNNLLNMLCSLYELKAITKQLVYDVIELLIEGEEFGEKELELLLMILKKVGFQLRSDDPQSLMKVIQQCKLFASNHELNAGSRIKFLVDTITAVKNNNVQKIRDYNVEVINDRRKKVKSLSSVDLESLADVKLKDLLQAETEGRWWLVGSAWNGNQYQRNRDASDKETNEVQEQKNRDVEMEGVGAHLIEAARKMRMNTEARRKVFFATMTATDFQEAFDNIRKLELKGKQVREIGNVLIELCQQQKKFTLFYFQLINKFCQVNRDYVVIFQCSMWDRFKLLKEMKERKKNNLATLVAYLLHSSAINISCFKTIKFTEMDEPLVKFLRQLFVTLARVSGAPEECARVFNHAKQLHKKRKQSASSAAAAAHKHAYMGVKLFVSHFMCKDKKFMAANEDLREHFLAMNDAMTLST